MGKTKDGTPDMIYRPEHLTDLDSGAIISTQVRPGNAADSVETTERVTAAVGSLAQAIPEVPLESFCQQLAADECYFAIEEIAQLHQCNVRTVIADPQASKRRKDKASAETRSALRRASRALSSKSGKALLRKWGEHLERGFCHVLDHGGVRRATLHDCQKLSKRHLVAATTFNLSLLRRRLFGVGTPKQALAGAASAIWRLAEAFLVAHPRDPSFHRIGFASLEHPFHFVSHHYHNVYSRQPKRE